MSDVRIESLDTNSGLAFTDADSPMTRKWKMQPSTLAAASAPLSTADLIVVSQSGVAKRATVAQIGQAAPASYRVWRTVKWARELVAAIDAGDAASVRRLQRVIYGVPGKTNTVKSIAIVGADDTWGAAGSSTIAVSNGTAAQQGGLGIEKLEVSAAYNAVSAVPVTGSIALSGSPVVGYVFPTAAGRHEGLEAIVEIEVSEP